MLPPQRRGIIDLGTNTFHLLIADVADRVLTEVYRERCFVKLAADGIDTIGPAPYARGQAALSHFAGVLRDYDCSDLTAFGTAALRTASNGPHFVAEAKRTTGITVTPIDGDREAELITRGVLAALPPLNDRVLIMDIGGGSTEFIIADAAGVHWRQSFPIGVSVLTNDFHHNDLITYEEIVTLQAHLQTTTAPLAEALRRYPTRHLIGAAGTFEVLADLLSDPAAPGHPTSHALKIDGLRALHDRILRSTLAERLRIEGLPTERADMIVAAMVLLDFVLQLAGIEKVTVSDYAMKEGILLGG